MTAAVTGKTLLRLGVRSSPRRRLVCLPFAGGGVAAYRQWFTSLPDDVEVLAAQLPGRESLLREPPLSSIHAMVDAVLPAVEAVATMPYALFGHSLGALVAFELAVALEQSGVRPPSRLFVSARRSPDDPETKPPVHSLPEAEFLDELQERYGAIPEAIRNEPELLELLLPTLRADIQAVETYVRTPGARVDCPVIVYGGERDTHPTPTQLLMWARVVRRLEHVRLFPGDHFYLHQEREALTADIASHWPSDADGPAGA